MKNDKSTPEPLLSLTQLAEIRERAESFIDIYQSTCDVPRLLR